jgi:HEXXH motif-containing protein
LDRLVSRLEKHLDQQSADQLRTAASIMTALPPGTRRGVNAHPYYQYWLVRQYQRIVDGDLAEVSTAMLDIGRYVAIPALQHNCWPERPVTLRARNCQLRFPGHLRHIQLPAGTPDGPVHLTRDSDALRIKASHCDISVAIAELLGTEQISQASHVRVRTAIPGTTIEVDGTDPYVLDLFTSINGRPPADNYPPNDLAVISHVDSRLINQLAAAHQLITDAWPGLARELGNYTKLLVPFTSRSRSTFAEAAFLGAVFLGECRHPFADPMFTAEHLLHEHSHTRLTVVMQQDLLFEAAPDLLLVSPWRRDLRPVIGVVQGVFVFARIARFLRYAHHVRDDERFLQRRTEVRADLRSGVRCLREASEIRFTPVGAAILDQCEAEADTSDDAGSELSA